MGGKGKSKGKPYHGKRGKGQLQKRGPMNADSKDRRESHCVERLKKDIVDAKKRCKFIGLSSQFHGQEDCGSTAAPAYSEVLLAGSSRNKPGKERKAESSSYSSYSTYSSSSSSSSSSSGGSEAASARDSDKEPLIKSLPRPILFYQVLARRAETLPLLGFEGDIAPNNDGEEQPDCSGFK
jgi:hypothetical protein